MENKNPKRAMWLTDIDTVIEVYELAKKENITLQQAFEKVLPARDDKIKFIGTTDKDGDLISGELRERGHKILNINELERRKNNEKQKEK